MSLCHPSFFRYKPSLKITIHSRYSKSIVQRIPSRNASWFSFSKDKSQSNKLQSQQPQKNDIQSLYKKARTEYKDKYFKDTKDAFDETLVQPSSRLDVEGNPFQVNKMDFREYFKMSNMDPEYPLRPEEEPRSFRLPAPPISVLQPGLLLGREQLYKSMINLLKKRKRFAWKVKIQKQISGAPFKWFSRVPMENMNVQEALDLLGFLYVKCMFVIDFCNSPWEAKLLSYNDVHSRALQLAGLNHPDIGGNPYFYRLIEACRGVLDVKYKFMDDEKKILAHNDFEVLIRLGICKEYIYNHIGLDEFYKYMKNQVEFNMNQIYKVDVMEEIAAPPEEKRLAFLENSGKREQTLMAAVWRAWKENDKKREDEKALMQDGTQMQNLMYLQWKDAWKNMQQKQDREKYLRQEAMRRNRSSYYGSKIYVPGDWKD